MALTEREIEDAQIAARQNEDHLFRIPNVCSVGVGYKTVGGERTDEISVIVSVRRKAPLRELRSAVPREVLGRDGRYVTTDVEEEGPLVPAADYSKYRPVLGGTVIMGGGSLGAFVVDPSDLTRAFLTNNHVFGSFASGPTGPNVTVTQPGPAYADRIGYVKRYVPLYVGPDPNAVPVSAADAALGALDPGVSSSNLVAGTADVTTSEGVEVIYERATPQLGDSVLKRGWFTELTRNGRVAKEGITIDFPYSGGHARIANCFAVDSTDGLRFWDQGDSGSLIMREAPGKVEGTLPALGLLFGGWLDGRRAYCSDINAVYAALNVSSSCSFRGFLRDLFGG